MPSSQGFVRTFARVLLTLFFRRVEVSGHENLPASGGGMLLAWHPNGLIDPALLLATFPGRIVFGARHGLFGWPLLGRLLRACAVPIHRRQDLRPGGEERALNANRESLAALADAVASGSYAVLFPEGDSHDESRPLALRTGAARLWLDAAARGPDRLPHVIPVGLHYDRKRLFRSRALVAYLPPLDLAAAATETGLDESGHPLAARRLTERFAEALDRSVLATDDWREHHLIHRLRRIFRAERAVREGANPGPSDMRERVRGFARVWTGYRRLREERREEIVRLRDRVDAYDRSLRQLGLEEHELDRDPPAPHGRVLALLMLQRFVLDALLPPLLLIGLVANLPTALLLEGLVRAGARRKKDQATIKLLAGAVLFPATWLALGALAAWGGTRLSALYPEVPDLPWLTGTLAALLSAVGGILILVYGRLSRNWGRALLVRLKRRLLRHRIDRLLAERAAIFAEAERLARDLDLPGAVAADGRVVDPGPPRPP